MTTSSRDLPSTLLAVLFMGALISASVWIMTPFLMPTVWATMIVVATWPLMKKIQALFRGRRGLAVTLMTLVLLLVLVIPFSMAVLALAENSGRIADWIKSLATWQVPPPPEFVSRMPLAGPRLSRMWAEASAGGPGYLTAQFGPYVDDAARWLLNLARTAGQVFVQFLLTVIVAAILYANGEAAAAGVSAFAQRLMGPVGDRMVRLAGQAIRGVALGVVVTAITQSVLAAIGLALSGVPLVAILTALCFVLALAQVGPLPALVPLVIWLYWKGDAGKGTILLVFTILAGTVDNVLRPILIKRGADLPLLLVFSGVIGGLIAFGLVGIFVGPVVLAVSYTLLEEWVTVKPAE